MMKFIRWAALPLSLFIFSSCSITQGAKPLDLGYGVNFYLESPKSFGREAFYNQKLEVTYLKKKPNAATTTEVTQEVIVQLEIDKNSMRLVALGQMGISLFQMSWDGANLTVQKPPGLELPFAPEYLIANMQLALWEHFPKNQHLEIIDTPKGRILKAKGKAILVITYPMGKDKMAKINIEDKTRKFKIKITRLD